MTLRLSLLSGSYNTAFPKSICRLTSASAKLSQDVLGNVINERLHHRFIQHGFRGKVRKPNLVVIPPHAPRPFRSDRQQPRLHQQRPQIGTVFRRQVVAVDRIIQMHPRRPVVRQSDHGVSIHPTEHRNLPNDGRRQHVVRRIIGKSGIGRDFSCLNF